MRQFPCGQVYSSLYFRKYKTCARDLHAIRYKYWYGRTLEGILPSTYHGTVFLVAAKSKKDVRAATARGFP
jgi:hypothetical protein